MDSNFRLDCWQGSETFHVGSNQSYSEIYVAHCVSDEAPEFNFRYSLVDSERNASGTYQITRIHSGYSVDVSTDLYIWDIPAWLQSQLTSAYPPSSTPSETNELTSSNQGVSSEAKSSKSVHIFVFVTLVGLSLHTLLRYKKPPEKLIVSTFFHWLGCLTPVSRVGRMNL